MHILKTSILSTILLVNSVYSSEFGELNPYVPNGGKAIADVMVLVTSKKVEEIGLRFQNSLKENPVWFKTYLSKAEKGKPLEFHKNFGISEKEYKYFLAESNKMQLVKSAETTLQFTITTNGNIEISGLPSQSPHNRLVYNIKSNKVEIASTTLGIYSEINQTKSHSATGRWKGKQWSYKQTHSESDFKAIKFAIGTKKDEQKHIIYYDVNIVIKGQPQNLSYILHYDAV